MTPTTNPTLGDQAITVEAAGATPAGWHRDPLRRFPLRYWDGRQWTENVVNAQRQVGVDVGWADAAARARAQVGSSAPTEPAAPRRERAELPQSAQPEVQQGPTEPAGPAVTARPTAAENEPERFDISPEAVLSRRAALPTPAGTPASPDSTGPAVTVPTPAPHEAPAGPTAARRALSALGRVPSLVTSGWVATGFALVAVVAVVAMGLSWQSSSRSYDAQEAWQDRAEAWEERAGEHADERDEAIAQVGQTRQRNRTLTEDIAELEDQIEGLAADNAALQDENRLLTDALADLGYRLAP